MAKTPMSLRDRIGELEDELKQRDARIRELRADLNKAETLITEEREHIEDAHRLIDSWIEAFDMAIDENGKWTYAKWMDDAVESRHRYRDLVTKWNRNVSAFNNTIAPAQCRSPASGQRGTGAASAQAAQGGEIAAHNRGRHEPRLADCAHHHRQW